MVIISKSFQMLTYEVQYLDCLLGVMFFVVYGENNVEGKTKLWTEIKLATQILIGTKAWIIIDDFN